MTEGVLPGPSLESQIIFRLASLEATVNTSLHNINEKLDNLQKDFHHKDVNRATQITAVDTRLSSEVKQIYERIDRNSEQVNNRITKLEFFKTEILAKATAAAAVVGLIWVMFGDVVKQLVGVI